MKLRLSGNTVRLRLDADDVERLTRDGYLTARLAVRGGSESWSYGLALASELTEPSLALEPDGLRIRLPREAVENWARSDREGIYGESDGVEISVEKDLPCRHRDADTEEGALR